jgi:hypothetical protein
MVEYRCCSNEFHGLILLSFLVYNPFLRSRSGRSNVCVDICIFLFSPSVLLFLAEMSSSDDLYDLAWGPMEADGLIKKSDFRLNENKMTHQREKNKGERTKMTSGWMATSKTLLFRYCF